MNLIKEITSRSVLNASKMREIKWNLRTTTEVAGTIQINKSFIE